MKEFTLTAQPDKTDNEAVTKLEYFAAIALQGILSNPNYILGPDSDGVVGYSFRDMADESVIIAKALIKAIADSE